MSRLTAVKKVLSALLVTTVGMFSAFSDTTYTTLNGTVNLAAGLTALTSATAINTTNQSAGINYITDSSWSTGILNLGTSNTDYVTPNNGTLAGTFGGGTYSASLNSIILIGVGALNTAWGGWTLRLLLSNDTYSSAISYNDSNLVANPTVKTAADSVFFQSTTGDPNLSPGAFNTFYQMIDIATFDTGNIGVKGIELSAFATPYPDITYIGVTGVPEPSALSLLAFGLGVLFRRGRKRD